MLFISKRSRFPRQARTERKIKYGCGLLPGALILALLLSGCTQEQQGENAPPPGVDEEQVRELMEQQEQKNWELAEQQTQDRKAPPLSEQAAVLAGQSEEWLGDPLVLSDWSYTVTDLNGDGWYELLRGGEEEDGVVLFAWQVFQTDESAGIQPLVSCLVGQDGIEWYADPASAGVTEEIIQKAAASCKGLSTAGGTHFEWIRNMPLLSGASELMETQLRSSAENFVYGESSGEVLSENGSLRAGGSRKVTQYALHNDSGNGLLMFLSCTGIRPDERLQKEYPALAAALTALTQEQELTQDAYDQKVSEIREQYESGENFNTCEGISSLNLHRLDDRVCSLEIHTEGSFYEGGTCKGINLKAEDASEIGLEEILTDCGSISGLLCQKLEYYYPGVSFTEEYAETIDRLCTGQAQTEDGLSWVLENDGITFYFEPGTITESTVGTLSVMLTDTELGELRTENYRGTDRGFTIYPQLGEAFWADVDGNGTADRIQISQGGDRHSEHYSMSISAGDGQISDSLKFYEAEPVFLHTADGRSYLYIEYTRDEDDRVIRIYSLGSADSEGGGEIRPVSMGSSNNGFAGVRSEEGLSEKMLLLDPEYFLLDCHFNMLASFEGRLACRVGENGLPETISEGYEIYDAPVLIARQSMELDRVDPETGEIKGQRKVFEGDRLTFKATDGSHSVDLQLDNGIIVRVTSGSQQYFNDGLAVSEYFINAVLRD